MAHITYSNIQKVIKIIMFLMPLFLIFIITNGVVSDGHIVEYDDFVTASSVPKKQGYTQKENYFYVSGEDPYITFYHYSICSEFTVFFNEESKEDLEVPVWLMSNDGKIYGEKKVVWKKGSRFISVEVPDTRVMLVSMKINRDFSIYHIMSSNPYHTYRWKVYCLLSLMATLLIIYGLLYKFGFIDSCAKKWASRILKKYRYYKNRRGAFVKSILVRVVIIFGSLVLSILILFILSKIHLRFLNLYIQINVKTVFVLSIFIGYIQFVIVYRRNIAKRFPIFVFLSILAIGATYVIAESGCVGISWDDQIHYNDAVKLSHCFDGKENMAEWVMNVAYAWYPWSKVECANLFSWFEDFYDGNYVYAIQNYNFSPAKLVYLPYVIGLCVARGLNLSLNISLCVAKYFDVIFLAVISYFASKRLNCGRVVVLLIALIPTNIFLASNFSYDVWVTGWIMLGYACLFNEINKKDDVMSDWIMVLIPLCFALAPLRKYVYFVLTFPAFFVSAKKFKTKARKWIYKGLLCVAIVVPFITIMINNIINAGEGDKRGGEGVNSAKQIEYILANTGDFVKTLLNFLRIYLNPFSLNNYNSPIDNLAYAGTIGIGSFIMIFIVVCSFISHEQNKDVFPWWYRVGIIIVYIATGAICAVAMYISYNPVGASGIGGCQGRYIIPVLFPTLYVLTRIPCKNYIRDRIKEYNFYALVGGVVFTINIYGIWLRMLSYY